MPFAIARKPTDRMPTGRAIGRPNIFETREAAQKYLDSKREWDWYADMHVIETDGEIKVAYPPAPSQTIELDELVKRIHCLEDKYSPDYMNRLTALIDSALDEKEQVTRYDRDKEWCDTLFNTGEPPHFFGAPESGKVVLDKLLASFAARVRGEALESALRAAKRGFNSKAGGSVKERVYGRIRALIEAARTDSD
jgi:hypothetical protein